MYGWINCSLRDLVVKNYGEEKWLLIVENVSGGVTSWVQSEYYPDTATFDLVGAACEILGIEGEQLLQAFGAHFLNYCNSIGYDNLLQSLGSNLGEWLSNVNLLHKYLESTFSEHIPPHFWCYDDDDIEDALILQYKSTRGAGLEGIVVGIVKEAAAMFFHLDVTMELLSTQGVEGSEFTVWRICESGSIKTNQVSPKMTSPAQMNEEVIKKLKNAASICPFQRQRNDIASSNEKNASSRISVSDITSKRPSKVVSRSSTSSSSSSSSPSSSSPPSSSTSSRHYSRRMHLPPIRSASTTNVPATSSPQSSRRSLDSSTKSRRSNTCPDFESMNITNFQPTEKDCHSVDILNVNRLNSRNHDSKLVEQHCAFGLSGKQLSSVFPFHIVFDKELTILQCGHELRLFLEAELVGEKVEDIFRVKRPCALSNWSEFLLKTKSENVYLECILEQRYDALQLSGTAICDDNDIVTVLCSPNVKNLTEMTNQGLTMSDIPKTDCRYEMILTTEHLQSETKSIARMTKMAEELEAERQTRMRMMQEAADNAESALATKRAFVRYVSHEIRTPLTVSMLGLELIADEVKALGAGESEMSNIADCQDSINIAVSILNDLLSYEKLESGILEISASFVCMTSYIHKCLKPFKLQARQKDVTFLVEDETKEDSENPSFINVDKTKMSQVIRNLSSNAIKFTPSGGTVRVVISTSPITAAMSEQETSPTARIAEIDGRKYHLSPKGELQLQFIDSGVGIAQDNQKKVFKEIVQFSPNELQAGGGSGLGLWISQGLVELHEGQIGMESEGIGHGSTFFVKLPIYGCNSADDIIDANGEDFDNEEGQEGKVDDLLVTKNGDHTVLARSISNTSSSPECRQGEGGRADMQKKSLVRTHSNSSIGSKTSGCSDHDDVDMFVLNGLHILVVDDAAMIRKVFQRKLVAQGATCFLAEDGVDAIAKVQELQYEPNEMEAAIKSPTPSVISTSTTPQNSHIITPPREGGDLKTYDVILMDFIMPVMDGPAATKILRQNGYKGLIVGVTGNMMPSDVTIFEEAGASAVFAKPLELNKLVRFLNLNLDFECNEVL